MIQFTALCIVLTYWANFFNIWSSFFYLSLKLYHTDKLVLNLRTQVKHCQVFQIQPSQFLETTQACPYTRNYQEPPRTRRQSNLTCLNHVRNLCYKNHPYTHRISLDGYKILTDSSLLVRVSGPYIFIIFFQMMKMIFLLHTCRSPEKDRRCEGLKQVLQKFVQLLPSSKFPDCPATTWEWHSLSLRIESLEADRSLYPRSEGTNILAELYVTSRPMLIKKCILWVCSKVEIP